jgi:hypothetical protein
MKGSYQAIERAAPPEAAGVQMVAYGDKAANSASKTQIDHMDYTERDAQLKLSQDKAKGKADHTEKIIFMIIGVFFVLGLVMIALGVAKKLGASLGSAGKKLFDTLEYIGIGLSALSAILAVGKWVYDRAKANKTEKKDGEKTNPDNKKPEPTPPEPTPPEPTPPEPTPPEPPHLRLFAMSGIYTVPALEDINGVSVK